MYQVAAVLDLSRSPVFGNPVLDARYQIEWAFALAAGEDLDRVFFQTPLYSYLLAAWLRAFGWSVWAIVTIHMILGVGVLVMVLALLRHFRVGPRLTYATLAFTALYPLFPFYAAMLHKSPLYSNAGMPHLIVYSTAGQAACTTWRR